MHSFIYFQRGRKERSKSNLYLSTSASNEWQQISTIFFFFFLHKPKLSFSWLWWFKSLFHSFSIDFFCFYFLCWFYLCMPCRTLMVQLVLTSGIFLVVPAISFLGYNIILRFSSSLPSKAMDDGFVNQHINSLLLPLPSSSSSPSFIVSNLQSYNSLQFTNTHVFDLVTRLKKQPADIITLSAFL